MQRKDKVVCIEWEDACSASGWRPLDDEGPAKIHSVGLLISRTDTHVTITSSRSSTGNFMDQLHIPKCAIKKFRELR